MNYRLLYMTFDSSSRAQQLEDFPAIITDLDTGSDLAEFPRLLVYRYFNVWELGERDCGA